MRDRAIWGCVAWLSVCCLVRCGGPRAGPTARSVEALEARFQDSPWAEAPDSAPWVAQRLAQDVLRMEDALALADARNPDLEALRGDIDLAGVHAWQSSLYPNPAAFAEFEDMVIQRGNLVRGKRVGGISHPLVLGGRRQAAVRAAELAWEASAMEYAARRRRILTDVKRAFLAVLAGRRRLQLARETAEVSRLFHDAVQRQFREGEIPEMPVLKAGVDAAVADARVSEADAAVSVAETRLRALLGGAWSPAWRFDGVLRESIPVPPLEELIPGALATHPEILAARAQLDQAEAEIQLARAERIPDINVVVDGGVDGQNSTIIEAGIEVPLRLYDRNQARIAAAQIRRAQGHQRLLAVENGVRERLLSAHRSLVAAEERSGSYREEILPQAQRALDQTQTGYDAGQFSYLDVLDAQRTLGEARTSCLAVVHEFNEAAAELEALIGRRLP